MPNRPIIAVQPRIFSESDLSSIHEAAVRILTEQGIQVLHKGARDMAEKRGFRVVGDRVHPDIRQIEEFVERTKIHGRGMAGSAPQPEPELRLGTHAYQTHYHLIDTDEIVPYTTELLIEATKFADTMHEYGVSSGAPGTPWDVPGDLRQLAQYKIGAIYSRRGRTPVGIYNARMMPYVMEMAEALGHPVRSFEIYMVSPLMLGSEYMDILLSKNKPVQRVGVSNMPTVGGTAPIYVADALALAVAEVIGGAMIVEAISGIDVGWSIRICCIDLRTMALSFGAPEEVLFQLAISEINAYYHGQEPGPPWFILHTQAKLPGIQAAAERMCQLMFGALFGLRGFGGGGTLSLDEIFSPEQLVIDVEMVGHVSRIIKGIDPTCEPSRAVAEVAAGREGGFWGLDSTAAHFRDVYWVARLFERRSLLPWQAAGRPDLRQRAKEIVREQFPKYDYEVEPDVRTTVERVYERAARELA